MGIRIKHIVGPVLFIGIALIASGILLGCAPTDLLNAVAMKIAGPVATPVFTESDGTYISGQIFSITVATGGATVYYTTDGSDPTTASTLYTDALTLPIDATTTVKAFGVKAGIYDSAIASATYTMVRRISTAVGNGTAGYAGNGGQSTAAQLNNPVGLAIDNLGNLFVSDYGNYVRPGRVRVSDPGLRGKPFDARLQRRRHFRQPRPGSSPIGLLSIRR